MSVEKINIEPVYISYASKSKRVYEEYARHSVSLVDNKQERDSFVYNLEKSLRLPEINYKIDREDVNGGNITEFENEIGDAEIVVVVLSDKYFISPHCMYEFDMIHKSKTTSNGKEKHIYYTYFDGEIINAEDGTIFKGSDAPMKNIDLEYYHKVVEPFWRQRFETLKAKVGINGGQVNLSDVEAYFCNGDVNNKKFHEDSKPYLFEPTFLDMHNKLSNATLVKDDRDLAAYIKNVCKGQQKFSQKCNWDRYDNLQERVPCVKGLLKKIQQYTYVNITGVGGYGKTSLANLLVFDAEKKVKHPFMNVAYFEVESNIKKSVVQKFQNSDFCTPDLKEKLNKLISTDTLDSKYNEVMECLGKCDTYDGLINLFILDINDYDEDLIKSFAEKLIDNTKQTDGQRLYPKGWKVLLISREPLVRDSSKVYIFNIDYNVDKTDKIDNDIAYLKDIFAVVKNVNPVLYQSYYDETDAPNDKLIQLFEYLRFSPQLVKILACKVDRYTKDIYKDLLLTTEQKARHKYEVFKKDKTTDQKTRTKYVGDYLKNLIRFNNLPKEEKYLLSYFMVWPSGGDIKHDVVARLTQNCKAIETSELLKQALKTAESKGHLMCKNDLSYSFHGMLADTVCEQFFDRFSFPLWRFLWYKFVVYKRYRQYIANCESVLSDVHVDMLDTYINCIAESVSDKYDIGYTSNLKNNQRLRTYFDIQSVKQEIKKLEKDGQSLELAFKYLKLGALYYANLQDYSEADALLYINKAVTIIAPVVADGDINYDKPDKQRFEILERVQNDINGIEVSDSKLSEFFGNVYCRLGDWYFGQDDEKAFGLYKQSIRWYEESFDDYSNCVLYTKKNIANSYYRYALMLELRRKGKANSFFNDADSIWASLSLENDGAFKGFVKTSYGLYNPEYQVKLVKVKCGDFEMGLSPEDYSNCCDNVRQEYYSYMRRSGQSEKALPYEKFNYEKNGGFFSDEIPCHPVRISEFYIAMFQTTNLQWKRVMGEESWKTIKSDGNKQSSKANGYSMDVGGDYDDKSYDGYYHYNRDDGGYNYDDCAMNYVSFYDAVEFCNRLSSLCGFEEVYKINENKIEINKGNVGFRLPTEAEWEFAAREANSDSRMIYSGSDYCGDVAHYDPACDPAYFNSDKSQPLKMDGGVMKGQGPLQVGTLVPNALGIYDMSGNVLEWCQDCYNSEFYGECFNNSELSDNPCNTEDRASGGARVLRGGSWNFLAQYCRVSFRNGDIPDNRYNYIGFRLSLSSQPKKE